MRVCQAMLVLLLGVLGCLPDGYSTAGPPPRGADVLIDAFGEGVVVFRDGDGPWQIAPRVGDKLGFDVVTDRYAVALVDAAHQRVDGYYTTVGEMSDVVFPAIAEARPRHRVSGTVSGLGDQAGRVTGKGGAVELAPSGDTAAPRPYQVEVEEGAQTIAFTRDIFVDRVVTPGELIVHRDVVIDRDRIEDVDFGVGATALDVTTTLTSQGCSGRTTFAFGNTEVVLATDPAIIATPPPAAWRLGDRLTIDRACIDALGFRTLTHVATTPDQIPPTVFVPSALPNAELRIRDGRIEVSWGLYFLPVTEYEAVIGDSVRSPCGGACGPRWSAHVSPGWSDPTSTTAIVLSPRDLEDLGIWDDRLAIAAGEGVGVAVNLVEQIAGTDGFTGVTHRSAGRDGQMSEALP